MLQGSMSVNDALSAISVSGGYLLSDRKKCQGCASCMLACSLVHERTESLALSRIRIIQDSKKLPDDLDVEQFPWRPVSVYNTWYKGWEVGAPQAVEAELDKGYFEKFRTRLSKREGWDTAAGWP